jgi:hypothetical protein
VWLAPTRLALALAGSSSGQTQHDVTDGFIVVETNYRVRFMPSPASSTRDAEQMCIADHHTPEELLCSPDYLHCLDKMLSGPGEDLGHL